MSVNREAIEQITQLARLSRENTRDSQSIQDDLNRIVQMVDQIRTVNTEGVLPMAHAFDSVQPWRPDEVTEPNQRDDLMKLAPKSEAGLYLVPTVIEE
jgi:aspartyl-tRNA(Asn)/glutamyl-tRNA(Gln) amidotransferase subunit C